MNGKLIILGIITIGVTVWLLQGWYAANDTSSARESMSTTTVTAASSTPPATYVATTTDTQVVLDQHPHRPAATLRGLGYGTLPLQATSTANGAVYSNTNEMLRAEVYDNQLRVIVADVELFTGVRATTTTGE